LRVLAHLSDLHFGRVDPAVLEPLRRRLLALAPHLVVVSGDLTQRARAREFRAARAYLDTLPKPLFVVPGNHDVPLYNLFARFLRPLAGYRRLIAEDPDPSFADEEIAVLGLNTARSFTWKRGAVSEAQLARVQELCRRYNGRTKVLVTHHPFMALDRLAHCGVDLLLAGHLHAAQAGPAAVRAAGPCALMVQAGTATSQRTRKEPNSFNLLRVGLHRIQVERHVLRGGDFVRAASETFSREASGWKRNGPA
jgi:predicted MPP superfamily phosphohydrolase